MTLLTGGHLAKIGRKKHRRLMDELADAFNYWLGKYGVTDDAEVSFILANVACETGGFIRLEENMNYSARRLQQVFSHYKRNPRLAAAHAHKPELIANTVYADENRARRFKLGNTRPGDGWKFRGNGPPQLTGRANHVKFYKATGIDVVSNPDLLKDPHMGVQATLEFYTKTPGLRADAKAGRLTAGRKKWNGGTHGLSDIKRYYLPRARAVMKSVQIIELPKDQYKEMEEATEEEDEDEASYVDSGSGRTLIAAMQRLLNERNYKVGAEDGIIGPETRAGMRKWLDAQNLPVEPLRIDLDALEASEAYVNEERAGMTKAEAKEALIDKGSRHITTAGRKKFIGGAMAGLTGLSAVADETKEHVETVSGLVETVKDVASPMSGLIALASQYWWLLLVGLGVYLWLEGDLTERLRIKIWKTGEHS